MVDLFSTGAHERTVVIVFVRCPSWLAFDDVRTRAVRVEAFHGIMQGILNGCFSSGENRFSSLTVGPVPRFYLLSCFLDLCEEALFLEHA